MFGQVEPLELDQYECLLCADVLNPADISVEWAGTLRRRLQIRRIVLF